MGDKIQLINCPSCQKTLVWKEENQFRPFCSRRCKLIDLGEWASEGYAITGEAVDPVADQDEQEF